MGLDFTEVGGIHLDALQLRAARMKVLASNIANAHTPGYQARDIDFAASLAQTRADEMGDFAPGGGAPELLYRVPYHPAQDGNTVELGVEQAEFSQNAMDLQTSVTFLNMKLRGLAKAIAGQ